MTPAQELEVMEAYQKFEAGDVAKAIDDLGNLAAKATSLWDRAELLYYRVLFLSQTDNSRDSRSCLQELESAVDSILPEAPPDTLDEDRAGSIALMARYAELKVLLAEGREAQALEALDGLTTLYPKQLSRITFKEVLDDINLHRGLLLADAGRWHDARPFLESAVFPEKWKAVMLYYRGRCSYEFREYDRAKIELTRALELGLGYRWEPNARYTLGIVAYHLSDLSAAKYQFELCVKIADADYLSSTKIWEWLEAVSFALGNRDDAARYRRMHQEVNPKRN